MARYSCSDEKFLDVLEFYLSVHTSQKHFGHSFAFDALTVWNELPYGVVLPPLLPVLQKLKSYLFCKSFSLHHNLKITRHLRGINPAMSTTE